MRHFFCLLAVAFLSGPLPAFAESGPEVVGSTVPGGDKNGEKKNNHQPEVLPELTEAELKLQPDEKLIYEIRVDGMPAGKAWLEVKKRDDLNAGGGPPIWVTTLTIKSSRLISLTYDVDDKALSKIDCKGGFSRFCHIERKDGEVEGEEISSFDYTFGNFKASYQRTRPSDRQMKTYAPIALTGKVLDPLAAIYYLRSIDWANQAKKAIDLPIFSDRKVWSSHVVIGEKDKRDFGGLKQRPYVKLKVDVGFKGLFERKGPMFVYLDLATGIPLRMEVEIPIGSAEVELSKHEKSPLDSGE